jgi:hypothetical protein
LGQAVTVHAGSKCRARGLHASGGKAVRESGVEVGLLAQVAVLGELLLELEPEQTAIAQRVQQSLRRSLDATAEPAFGKQAFQ